MAPMYANCRASSTLPHTFMFWHYTGARNMHAAAILEP